MASKHAWKVELIPWDHLSVEQVQRMYDQRVACGWRSEEVPSYVESAKKGGRIFYWIVITDAVPDRQKLLETHTKAYPEEATELEDTAREIRLVPRQPTGRRFTPIGHVALDIHNPEDDEQLGLPRKGVVWVHQLYVSFALQSGGFGVGAMSQVEALAAGEPMKAKVLALDTMAKETQLSPSSVKMIYQDRGLPIPGVSTQDWYARQGWQLYKRVDRGYVTNLGDGRTFAMDIVYMKKVIG